MSPVLPRSSSRSLSLAALAAVTALLAGACSASDATSSDDSTTASVDVLGKKNPASGDPVVFGVINLESGAVTFPEVLEGEQAAVKYVNEYLGGIDGHPVKLVTCATDGEPATSSRCANQILDQKPVAILGAADTAAPAAMKVWERADLPYLGGMTFTEAENTGTNSVQFYSISQGDNAALAAYAVDKLGASKGAVMYTDNAQGKSTGLGVVKPTMLKAGAKSVKEVAVPPAAADLSTQAAAVVQDQADAVYLNLPNGCSNALRALQSVGNQAKLLGIGPCIEPKALEAAGSAAEGLYSAQPFEPLDGGGEDAKLFNAVMDKYAKSTVRATGTMAGFGSVMNIQAALGKTDPATLTTKSILAAFRTGTDHKNFLSHPYTCDGEQLGGYTAVCSAYQRIYQVKNGKSVAVGDEWVTAGDNFTQ
ncbi:ABC transporter substrate-binding protein [Streptomyces aquilus]|uniref:ABC transporter substrate-binding protein n=1 Tax=Streptomyces aquilus TaxID=2548456 RepID=UPI0036C7C3AC